MTDREAAACYHWFITTGYRKPTLNDPVVIHGDSDAAYVDRLIVEGMQRWPSKS
jgi:hypothetical protein